MELKETLSRSELLLGEEGLESLRHTRVIIFGVGGVGSWCAEALVRTGVGAITMVDPDVVAPSNVNRQLPALLSTLGQPKVEVMARRLADINPQCRIEARCERYTEAEAAKFPLQDYDYVIDAIDSLADKAALILHATSIKSVTLLSSMGAARKLDPLRVQFTEFWKVQGCPLAAALRSRFRRSGRFPARKFKCVWSNEVQPNHTADKSAPNGSIMPVTAVWGLTLAAAVVEKRGVPTRKA